MALQLALYVCDVLTTVSADSTQHCPHVAYPDPCSELSTAGKVLSFQQQVLRKALPGTAELYPHPPARQFRRTSISDTDFRW